MHTMRAHHSLKQSELKTIISGILFSLLLTMLLIPDSFANRTYGPVKAHDYLSKIVEKNYPQTRLKKNQIMVAILRANPKAFRGGNIHFLKQGVTLVLPDEKDIATITPAEASAVIARQLVFFKRGETGHFVNPPLALTSISKEESTDTIPANENTITNKNNDLKQDNKIADQAIPPKIKIEIRKATQEKNNKEKQLETLEKISEQQTRTLTTLDQQIHILEEQLKTDAQQAQRAQEQNNEKSKASNALGTDAKTPEATPETKQPDSEDSIAENAISSLEAQLSQNAPAIDETMQKEEQETTQNTATVSETIDTSTSDTETKSETDNENIEIAATEPTTKTLEAAPPTSTTAASSEPAPVANTTTSSLFDSINNPLLMLFAALALGLLLLTYFFIHRSPRQHSLEPSNSPEPSNSLERTGNFEQKNPAQTDRTAVTTPFKREAQNKSGTTATLEIPDQEKLLNPVIKTDDIVKTGLNTTDVTAGISEQQYQEAEIKINMARAYMDMGYIDASREVLQEVLTEGSDDQKETVRQMLSMI